MVTKWLQRGSFLLWKVLVRIVNIRSVCCFYMFSVWCSVVSLLLVWYVGQGVSVLCWVDRKVLNWWEIQQVNLLV